MLANLPYIVVVALVLIGLATIVLKRNLIKIFLGIVVLESAVNLFIVSLGYREGGSHPSTPTPLELSWCSPPPRP